MDELIFQEFKGTGNMEMVPGPEDKVICGFIRRLIYSSRGRGVRSCWCRRTSCIRSIVIRRGLAGHKPEEAIERLAVFRAEVSDEFTRCEGDSGVEGT